MKNLPLKTQEIINLRIFQELPFTEIARIIWIWESGVKMSFLRWIEAIKNSLNIIILLIFLLII
jgi:DNA-directed RNA polymerase specialized sigma subunit